MHTLLTRLGFPDLRDGGVLLIVLLIDTLGSGLFAPFSLLYFQAVAGLPLATVGVALSVAMISALPVAPITGTLVDRFGARSVVAAAQVLQGIGFLGYLVVRTPLTLGVAAALVAIGVRMFWSAFFTLVADIAPVAERDRWYGAAAAAQSAGYGIGGLLSGLAITLGGRAGYTTIVVVNACTFFAAAVLLLVFVPERHVRHEEERGGYRVVLQDRPFVVLTVVNIVFALVSMLITVGLPVFATEALRTPPWLPGVILALHTAAVALTQTLVVRTIEPMRRTRVVIVATGLWILWCAGLALSLWVPTSTRVPYLIALTIVFTLAELIHAPTTTAMVVGASPDALRGRYLAAFQFSWGIASLIAPGMFTLLFTIQPGLPWLAMIALLAPAILATWWLEGRLPAVAIWKSVEGG